MKFSMACNQIIIAIIILLTISCGNEDVLDNIETSDAPTNLTATPISKNEIKLTWKDNSSSEDGFYIDRKEGPTASFQRIARTEANVTTYNDKSLSINPGTTYYYRVAYFRGNDVSDYSNMASATTLSKAVPLKTVPEAYIILKSLEHYSVNGTTGKIVKNGYSEDTWLDSSGVWYEDFTVSITEGEGGVLYYSIDGALTPDSCNNKTFVIKTLLPIYKLPAYPCPVEGEILVSNGDEEVALRFGDQVLEIDSNNDGATDDTVICQPVTEPDFCL